MAIDEIFSKVCAHMRKGLMLHDQIATAFSFLNLYGYQKCHEYHFYEESVNYRCLQNFYLNTYHKLIPEQEIKYTNLIPTNWYKYARENVDTNTKRSAVKDLFKQWVEWEKQTKTELQSFYKQALDLGEICAAENILYFLKDVSEELRIAQEIYIGLDNMNYDIIHIIEEQDSYFSIFTKKIKKLYKDGEHNDKIT